MRGRCARARAPCSGEAPAAVLMEAAVGIAVCPENLGDRSPELAAHDRRRGLRRRGSRSVPVFAAKRAQPSSAAAVDSGRGPAPDRRGFSRCFAGSRCSPIELLGRGGAKAVEALVGPDHVAVLDHSLAILLRATPDRRTNAPELAVWAAGLHRDVEPPTACVGSTSCMPVKLDGEARARPDREWAGQFDRDARRGDVARVPEQGPAGSAAISIGGDRDRRGEWRAIFATQLAMVSDQGQRAQHAGGAARTRRGGRTRRRIRASAGAGQVQRRRQRAGGSSPAASRVVQASSSRNWRTASQPPWSMPSLGVTRKLVCPGLTMQRNARMKISAVHSS